MKPGLFTDEMLDSLREQYNGIERIDPCSNAYLALEAGLNSMATPMLEQLAGANIKFVSKLAKNRLPIKPA